MLLLDFDGCVPKDSRGMLNIHGMADIPKHFPEIEILINFSARQHSARRELSNSLYWGEVFPEWYTEQFESLAKHFKFTFDSNKARDYEPY